MELKAWQEKISLPTYKLGAPDKNPMFLEKRVYQGSSGAVYPFAVIDKVYDEKEEKEYTALFLENEYLKVMILPELGGRIQMAYDKIAQYHFIYYNQVIKPALVGLAGPWISGGIEFNWPQHHRPSTFDAVDFEIVENKDGSKTVWVNEYEKMFNTKCALGFTLYPNRSYIELNAKLYNNTPFPQTFLWWANPAVSVDEHYQSVFPPDVHAVYDHGKRDVSSFPMAKGTYYKVDYSPGTDISKYNNIPVPTSYMAVNSKYDFVGGYHHQKRAGMVHVANHHVSPGKKQWTWGCGEFGQAWDKHLTDEDGPYFELMCGVFTDNQPDFSWIMPNETRKFTQYFMPYREVGYIKNASKDVVMNLEFDKNNARVIVYTTSPMDIIVSVTENGNKIFNENASVSPKKVFESTFAITGGFLPENYSLKVYNSRGVVLLAYAPEPKQEEAIPEPAKPMLAPNEIKTNEELYLAGMHLEQYRHATYNPQDYYNEAIKRDADDFKVNNALGLLLLRRGAFAESEVYFRKATDKLIKFNPNPIEGEPFYNLGLALTYQNKTDEAYNSFYKSAWNFAMQDNAFLQIAYLDAQKNNWNLALEHIERSLEKSYLSLKARTLKALVLYNLNDNDIAIEWCNESLLKDQFNYGCLFIKAKLEKNENGFNTLKTLLRNNSNTYITIAADFSKAGCYAEAIELLNLGKDNIKDPIFSYYLAFYYSKMNQIGAVETYLNIGAAQAADTVFPNRLDDIEVLQFVIKNNKKDYKAFYYLGNFYYAKKRYVDAKQMWEASINIEQNFATTHRNLGIALFNKFNEKNKALQCFEKAFELDKTDSRVLFELDQLYKLFKKSATERLDFLNKHASLISERDDLYIECVTLHTLTAQYQEAKTLLENRKFHPWEGGEGKTSNQHILINMELAKIALNEGLTADAIELLLAATIYPENLGEGKLHGAQENDINYWLGVAYVQLGDNDTAIAYWNKAIVGLDAPTEAIFYNDQQPDKIFYQGLAHLKLGNTVSANERFQCLINYGKANENNEVKIDFFAVSLPDLTIFEIDLNERNKVHCLYLIGLGYIGQVNTKAAVFNLKKVLVTDPAHIGATLHLIMISNLQEPSLAGRVNDILK